MKTTTDSTAGCRSTETLGELDGWRTQVQVGRPRTPTGGRRIRAQVIERVVARVV